MEMNWRMWRNGETENLEIGNLETRKKRKKRKTGENLERSLKKKKNMSDEAANAGRELFALAMDITNALIGSNRNRSEFYDQGDEVRPHCRF